MKYLTDTTYQDNLATGNEEESTPHEKSAHTSERNSGKQTLTGNCKEYYWPQKSLVVCTQRLDIWGHKINQEMKQTQTTKRPNPFTEVSMILTPNEGTLD